MISTGFVFGCTCGTRQLTRKPTRATSGFGRLVCNGKSVLLRSGKFVSHRILCCLDSLRLPWL